MGKVNNYALRAGMVIERTYRHKNHRLSVINEDGKLRFQIAGKSFVSLTAAAKFVIGTDTPISVSRFWGVRPSHR